MLRFYHPFSAIICGSSGSGKTRLTHDIIKAIDEMVIPSPKRVVWVYQHWQTLYQGLIGKVHFVDQIPELDELQDSLLVLDDMMSEHEDIVAKIFTRLRHHANLSVIYIIQNLFYKSKLQRTISLNSQYIILFKNPRDLSQINNLARQMFPGQGGYLVDAYKKATEDRYSYLAIDLRQETPDNLRLQSKILPGQLTEVYVPK